MSPSSAPLLCGLFRCSLTREGPPWIRRAVVSNFLLPPIRWTATGVDGKGVLRFLDDHGPICLYSKGLRAQFRHPPVPPGTRSWHAYSPPSASGSKRKEGRRRSPGPLASPQPAIEHACSHSLFRFLRFPSSLLTRLYRPIGTCFFSQPLSFIAFGNRHKSLPSLGGSSGIKDHCWIVLSWKMFRS